MVSRFFRANIRLDVDKPAPPILACFSFVPAAPPAPQWPGLGLGAQDEKTAQSGTIWAPRELLGKFLLDILGSWEGGALGGQMEMPLILTLNKNIVTS